MSLSTLSTVQDVKQYISGKVYGFSFDAIITRFKRLTYKSGIEAGRYINIEIKGHCFYIHEEGHKLHTIIECDRIEEQDAKVFIKAWKDEHAATVKVNELDKALDIANLLDKPTKRIENSIKVWTLKQYVALEPLYNGMTDGTYPINTVELIGDDLGVIGGYVADCFHATFEDYMGVEL
jgi:hypothetical protein